MSNQECKITSEIININTNEPMFSPYSIKIKLTGEIKNPIQ